MHTDRWGAIHINKIHIVVIIVIKVSRPPAGAGQVLPQSVRLFYDKDIIQRDTLILGERGGGAVCVGSIPFTVQK